MDRTQIFGLQILFMCGITFGSQSLDLRNKHQWTFAIARFIVYMLTVQGTKLISQLVYSFTQNQQKHVDQLIGRVNRNHVLMYAAAIALLFINEQTVFKEDFCLLYIAYLIVKYHEIEKKQGVQVTYGTGMACSFIEGYLVHILPSDGAQFVGFLENIRIYESKQTVVFPVKKLFLILPKSMHCPCDLKEFNDKSERKDIARLEACQSFEQVVKDVAGVKGRKYKNSAYKVLRPGARPVHVAAECATPLHTLYRVMKNRTLYQELADVNVDDILSDFTNMLRTCLPKSPELKDKCELICFDDTDPNLNLADIILDRVRELEPNFEKIINS